MAAPVQIKIEKFISMWPFYGLMIPLGVLALISGIAVNNLTLKLFLVSFLLIAFGGWIIWKHRELKRNPVVLTVSDDGLQLPHRHNNLFWQNFIAWSDFVDARDTQTNSYTPNIGPVKMSHLIIVFKDRNNCKRKYCLPYSHGNGEALNYTKIDIVNMIKNAAING